MHMNVIAMGQYANGAFASKYYAASGDWINTISDRSNRSVYNPPDVDNATAVLGHLSRANFFYRNFFYKYSLCPI